MEKQNDYKIYKGKYYHSQLVTDEGLKPGDYT